MALLKPKESKSALTHLSALLLPMVTRIHQSARHAPAPNVCSLHPRTRMPMRTSRCSSRGSSRRHGRRMQKVASQSMPSLAIRRRRKGPTSEGESSVARRRRRQGLTSENELRPLKDPEGQFVLAETHRSRGNSEHGTRETSRTPPPRSSWTGTWTQR